MGGLYIYRSPLMHLSRRVIVYPEKIASELALSKHVVMFYYSINSHTIIFIGSVCKHSVVKAKHIEIQST